VTPTTVAGPNSLDTMSRSGIYDQNDEVDLLSVSLAKVATLKLVLVLGHADQNNEPDLSDAG